MRIRLAVLVVAGLSVPAFAQPGPAPKPVPGQLDAGQVGPFAPPPEMNPTVPKVKPPVDPKLKAWDGIWTAEGPMPADVPFTEDWKAMLADYKKVAGGKEDTSNWARCIPNGTPVMMQGSFDLQVRPGAMNIFTLDHGFEYRHIFVDGREHTPPEYLFDTYGGESVGKWMGDTLAVDTVTLDSHNEIIPGVPGSSMHVIERWSMRGDGKLAIAYTVEDEQALTKPWTFTRIYARSKQPALNGDYCILAPRPDDPDALKLLGLQK